MKNLFLTGPPRSGKTTIIMKVIHALNEPVRGFFTAELRQGDRRVGFEVRTLDGKRAVLGHERFRGPHRVGKYGVDIKALDEVAVPSLESHSADEPVILDEIGKMECMSPLFRDTVLKLLASPNRVLGAIGLKGDPFIRQVRSRADVRLVDVTEKNRDELPGKVLELLNE